MNRNYESMIILKPDLEEKAKEEVFNKIAQRIKALDGEVIASKVWAKERTFYYFLRGHDAEKKQYYKCCYWLINVTLA